MDLYSVISQLRAEALQIERTIRTLELLNQPGRDQKRGRKPCTMTPEERQEVSERMRKYWAARRKEKSATA